MITAQKVERPLRVGVFATVADADRAVESLLADGFASEAITVISSDERKEQFFRQFEHQSPAGRYAPAAAAAGGVAGAALAGGAVVAAAIATGGVALLAAGGIAAWAGGVAGGLVGAMLTRGVEKEAANYYDQAVEQGKLLVAVESNDPADLARATRIFSEAGAEPVALREG